MLSNFYSRRKKPWVGFVLVLIFGPFGFLYHSWKHALGLLLVAGPAWIIFVRHTPFDPIENPWAHYVALLVLACFAFLQIKARNSEGDQELKVLNKLVGLAPSPTAAGGLADFINERPALRKRFLELSEGANFADSDNTMARLEVSGLLQSYAMHVGEKGDFRSAIGSASGAYMLVKEDVNPLAVLAEIYLALRDRIAARYAKKVLKFKPPKGKGLIETVLAEPEVLANTAEVKERMRVVVRECDAHPEWRDSYPLREASGTVEELL